MAFEAEKLVGDRYRILRHISLILLRLQIKRILTTLAAQPSLRELVTPFSPAGVHSGLG